MKNGNVAVIGASGYTGQECIKLIQRHRGVSLRYVVGNQSAGQNLNAIRPAFPSLPILPFPEVPWSQVDLALTCLPHGPAEGESMQTVAALRAQGVKVIDLSGDYRLQTPATYQTWYGHAHQHETLLKQAVYGLAEWNRTQIRQADLVANPGCYPTACLLALLPLVRHGLLAESIIIDAKSGMSGAGRSAKIGNLFSEMADNVRPYGAGRSHRHVGEIDLVLGQYGFSSGITCFTPQVVPLHRGMLCNLYLKTRKDLNAQAWQEVFQETYANEPFVKVLPIGQFAEIKSAVETNLCVLSLHPIPDGVLIMSSIDNLTKGAAGQAIQNMNLMLGFDEQEGLL